MIFRLNEWWGARTIKLKLSLMRKYSGWSTVLSRIGSCFWETPYMLWMIQNMWRVDQSRGYKLWNTSAKVGKTGMRGWNFSGQVSIHMDHKGIPDHIRVCLVVKFIVYYFQSNKIMVWIVKEATRYLIRWYTITISRKGFQKYPIIVTQLWS